MRVAHLFVPLIAALSASSCATIGYYAQAAGGQLELVSRSRPINDLLEDIPADRDQSRTPTSPELKARLRKILQIREYASRELKLPDNDSYRMYADIERPAVAWNVVATPEFSLKPMKWCFPFAGCVPYRGYFSHKHAQRFAAELKQQGLDVRVAAVTAYSTLGWFNDPVLSTQLHRNDSELAGLIFHELAHQKLYVPGDAAFNESFATAVEIEGLRRWLAQSHDDAAFNAYLVDIKRRAEFVQLARGFRTRLEKLYASPLSDTDKRAQKALIFSQLHSAYAGLRAHWNNDGRYDGWFRQDLNNAHLASLDTYHQYVPAFQALLQNTQGAFAAFYAAATQLGRLPAEERATRLSALGQAPVATVE